MLCISSGWAPMVATVARRLSLIVGCVASLAAPALAQDAYRFTYRGLDAGEQAVQQASFDMDLEMSINQAGQVIDSGKQGVARKQLCRLTVLETGDLNGEQVKTKVRITYESADQSVTVDGKEPKLTNLPVAGKTYTVERAGEKLIIADDKGKTPPELEQAIVATSTETLGKPNPMARFFHGRTIRLGEQLRMPPQMARDLLGFGGKLDNASRFEMKFAEVRNVNGVACGLFETYLETKMTQGTTMNMQMRGRVLLEIATCRAVGIELGGPVNMAEAHGPPDGQFTVDTKGNVKMALRAEYPRKQ